MRQTTDQPERYSAAVLEAARGLYSRVARGATAIFGGRALFYVSIALATMAFSALYLAHERAYPYWDYAAYQDATYAVADAFRRSFGEGLSLVYRSLNDDYNKLLTLPLVPLVRIFGESRLVYVWDVLIVYFIPFLLIVAAIARRIFPERANEATTVAVLATVFTPLTWRNILQGYADISGAVLIGAMVLLYDRSEHGARWRPVLACGVCAAFAVLLRRHYVYPDFAFGVAFFVDALVTALIERWDGRRLARSLIALAGSGVVALVVLAALAPEFVHRITTPGYAQYFAPWQATPGVIFSGMLGTIGVPALLVAIAGMVLVPRVTAARRGLARIIVVATITWALVWVFFVRQGPTHYPHALPFFMAIGLTSAWLYARTLREPVLRIAGPAAIAALLLFGTAVALPLTEPAIAFANSVPRSLAPYPEPPHVNPGYTEITRLVYLLHARAGPSDGIVVAASSQRFNLDLLREAERTIFGPAEAKLQIEYTPQFDSTNEPPPSDALDRAKYVLVVEPFLHDLPADQTKRVHVLVDVFEQHWKAAEDFRPLPDRFDLGDGVSLRVYERMRPASAAVALDTQRRMAEYVRSGAIVQNPPTGTGWVEASSPYAVTTRLNGDGSTTVFANPAREDQQPQTILVHPEERLDDVRISAGATVLDSRCPGARLVFGTEYRGAQFSAATPLAPNQPAKHLDVLLRHVHGNPIFMKVGHAASSPKNVDYCTVSIDHLRLTSAGRPLQTAVARALRSGADPFESTSSPPPEAGATPATQAVSWIRRSSPFPMDVVPTGDGSYIFSGHPTRVGDEPDTVIEFGPTQLKQVRLTALVRFYTPQCKGAQILAGTNYGSGDTPVSIGVFTPSTGGRRFDAIVRGTAGKTVYLNFKANPATPRDIDYCTMRLEELRVAPA